MKKKILSIIIILVAFVMLTTNVHAQESLFKMEIYEEIYKLSEQTDAIDLPFFNFFSMAATYDKDVEHSGISFASSTIDVNEKLEGMHVIFSQDMVSIKGEVQNAFIYGNNIVIEGRLTGDTILMAPTVQILEGAEVSKDVIIIANNLNIQGNVKGNVIGTISEKTTISGVIEKDLRIITSDILLENETINGDIYIETYNNSNLLLEKYPEAVIKDISQTEETKPDIMTIITKGIVTVIIYSIICFLITKKENNFVHKAYLKFKEHTVFGIISAFIVLMLVPILPLLLIMIAMFGLGTVAWPILIAYIALILISISVASLVVGSVIYTALKDKVGKYKLVILPAIFTVLYAICNIQVISLYAIMAINLISLGIIITMLTKKLAKPNEQKQ